MGTASCDLRRCGQRWERDGGSGTPVWGHCEIEGTPVWGHCGAVGSGDPGVGSLWGYGIVGTPGWGCGIEGTLLCGCGGHCRAVGPMRPSVGMWNLLWGSGVTAGDVRPRCGDVGSLPWD